MSQGNQLEIFPLEHKGRLPPDSPPVSESNPLVPLDLHQSSAHGPFTSDNEIKPKSPSIKDQDDDENQSNSGEEQEEEENDPDKTRFLIDSIFTRAGEDGQTPAAPGAEKPAGTAPQNGALPGSISPFPGFPGIDLEIGSITPPESIPDVNVYQHKKTLAQGMMDLALFSANANQLRYVLESANRHPYYYSGLVLISFSLLLQVGVGCGLVWNATYNVKDKKEICIANKINNFTVVGIFLVTVVNVFICAFGVSTPAIAVPTPAT